MIELLHKDACALLKQIIAIPSPSCDEGQVCSYISDWLNSRGYRVEREANNIWVKSVIDESLPVILLNSHIDTILPSSGWNYDPFIPFEDESKITGLGSNDAGASIVSLVAAFILLDRLKDRKYNIVLALTAEGEIWGKGGIELVYDRLGRIDLAIVGEPTSMKIAVCERGLLVLDCNSNGTAAHVSNRNGDNAILHAIADIEKLRKLNFEKVSAYLGGVQLEVTQIQGGTLHFMTPDRCNFVVDIRINELYSHEEIVELISREIKSEIKPRSLRLKSTIFDENHPLIFQAKNLGIETTGSGSISDMALIPCPAVKIGPGDTSRSSKPDEYVLKDEIKHGITMYYNLLKDFSF